MEKMHYSDKNLSGKSFSDGYHSMEEMVRDIFGEKRGSKGWTVCMAAISMMLTG